MSKPAAAIGGAAAAAVVISVAEAREWVALAQDVAAGKSPFLAFCLIVLGVLGYLLFRQWRGGEDCALRVHQLESVVQGMYAILVTDDRYQGMPPYEDFAAGRFSIADIHRARSAAFNRANP